MALIRVTNYKCLHLKINTLVMFLKLKKLQIDLISQTILSPVATGIFQK